ncbi:hypothetical protein MTO96_042797 [Rhipicephalus appendiculatus]
MTFQERSPVQRLAGMPVIVSCRSLSRKVVDNVPGCSSSVTASNLPAKAAVNASSRDKATSAPPFDISGKVSCPKTHKCQLCPYVAKYPSVLAQHMRTHSNERPYKCNVCGLTFKREHHLVVHRRIHSGEKQYKCVFCSHACVTKFALESHMRRHTGTPVIVASQSLSQEIFDNIPGRPPSATASNLSAEVAVNASSCDDAASESTGDLSGEATCSKTLSCQYCPFVARYPSVLVLHLRTHSDERPYKCNVCGLTFKRQDHRDNHRRIHTGERKYKCSLCPHTCVRKYALKSHMRRHTGEKPYQCTHCPARFTYIYQLKHHIIQKEHA